MLGEASRRWPVGAISPKFHFAGPGFKDPGAGAGQVPGMPYSPACWRTWGPAHTQGPSDWHLALILRPCFHLGGTWTSRIPSCSQQKGRQEGLRLGRAHRGFYIPTPPASPEWNYVGSPVSFSLALLPWCLARVHMGSRDQQDRESIKKNCENSGHGTADLWSSVGGGYCWPRLRKLS